MKEDRDTLGSIRERVINLAKEEIFENKELTGTAKGLRAVITDFDRIISEQAETPDLQNAEQPEQTRRELSLTEEEVYMVTSSLSLAYKQKISLAIDNRGILPNTAIDDIFADANKFDTLAGAIFEGNRDKK